MRHSIPTEEATRAVDFKVLEISSPVSGNIQLLEKFTAEGANINPSFFVQHIPQDAKSLALVMLGRNEKVHWLIWNIPVTHHIKENEPHGTTGMNSFGHQRYDGPEVAAGFAAITVKVYALRSVLPIEAGATLHELEKVMSDEIIAFGCLSFNEPELKL